MRRSPDLTTLIGSLALAGTLALLSPGIEAVRADDAPEVSTDSEGLTCEAGTIRGGEEVTAELRRIQQLQIEQMKQAAPGSEADGEAIVLNNRGYNYGPANLNLPHPQELRNER